MNFVGVKELMLLRSTSKRSFKEI